MPQRLPMIVKASITAAVASAAFLTFIATPAEAHKLTRESAALDARIEVSERADHQCNRARDCEFAHYPKLTKYDCRRRSQHVVVCDGSVELDYEFPSGGSYTEIYFATVRVRLFRYRTGARITSWN